jgi:hypothetical protein
MQLPTHTEEMACKKTPVLEADVDVQLHEQAEDGNQMPLPLPLAEDSENVFQLVNNKKPVKELSPEVIDTPQHTVYMKGVNGNFVQEVAIKHANAFKHSLTQEIGGVINMTVDKDSLKILCSSKSQKTHLLSLNTIMEQPVVVTLPHYITRKETNSKSRMEIVSQHLPPSTPWKKGVIKLPYDIDLDDVKNETGAKWIH